MSYQQVAITDLVDKIKTWNPNKDKHANIFTYVDLGSLDKDRKIINTDLTLQIKPKEAPSRARQLIKKSDVLVATVRPNLNGVAIVPENLDEATASTGYCVLRANSRLNPLYLFYWTRTAAFINDMVSQATGASYPAISDKIIKQSQIPLPSLIEQDQIVKVLGLADSSVQQNLEIIKQYDLLSQSVFLDMFGDPVINMKQWRTLPFKDSVIDIIGGKSVSGTERTLKSNELAVIKISAVTSGNFNQNEYKVVEEKNIPDTLIKPKKGDLLFSRANTRELVGAVCVVDQDYDSLFLPDKIWKIVPKVGVVNQAYLKFLLSHEGFRDNLRKVATGSSGSMLNISKAKLNALMIPVPPFDLQTKFEARLTNIEEQKKIAQQSLKKSEELFNSLLQQAFKGELTQTESAN